MIRKMIPGGHKRKKGENGETGFNYYYNSEKIHSIAKTTDVSEYIKRQQKKWTAHLIRTTNSAPTKQFMFNSDKYRKRGRHAPELLEQVIKENGVDQIEFISRAINREF